jgi:hypothetical protein
MDAFCQLSTAYAYADKPGFIEEKMVETNINWSTTY